MLTREGMALRRTGERMLTASWTVQERATEDVLASLSILHATNAKAYTAVLRRVTDTRDGCTSFAMFQDDARILTERVGRYSRKGLAEFAERAIDALIAAQDDARIQTIIEQREEG
jgi:hypothetical protein